MDSSCFRRRMGLGTGLPGVWHDVRCLLIVTFDFLSAEVDAGGHHQFVIGDAATLRSDGLGGRVDGGDFIEHHLDAVVGDQFVVANRQR